jgi:nicotinamidase-related amidase
MNGHYCNRNQPGGARLRRTREREEIVAELTRLARDELAARAREPRLLAAAPRLLRATRAYKARPLGTTPTMSSGDQIVEALLVLDVINDFEHDDGDRLLASLRDRAPALEAALAHARRSELDVIYVNDAAGRWDGERSVHVARALDGRGGDVVGRVAPEPGDRFLFKGTYSAFDRTPLARLLDELGVTRVVLAGAATEMCVAQTAITAREIGLQVTVLRDACAAVDPGNERIALAYLEHVTGSVILPVESWRTAGLEKRTRRDTAA